jgi:hypothetical protein
LSFTSQYNILSAKVYTRCTTNSQTAAVGVDVVVVVPLNYFG